MNELPEQSRLKTLQAELFKFMQELEDVKSGGGEKERLARVSLKEQIDLGNEELRAGRELPMDARKTINFLLGLADQSDEDYITQAAIHKRLIGQSHDDNTQNNKFGRAIRKGLLTDKRFGLEEIIVLYPQAVERLAGEISRLEKENSDLEDKLETAKGKQGVGQEEVDEKLRNQKKELDDAHNVALQNKVKELEDKYESRLKEVREEAKQQRDQERAEHKEQIAGLKKEHRETIAEIRAEHEKVRGNLATVHTRHERVWKRAVNERNTEIEQQSQRIMDLEEQVFDLDQTVDGLLYVPTAEEKKKYEESIQIMRDAREKGDEDSFWNASRSFCLDLDSSSSNASFLGGGKSFLNGTFSREANLASARRQSILPSRKLPTQEARKEARKQSRKKDETKLKGVLSSYRYDLVTKVFSFYKKADVAITKDLALKFIFTLMQDLEHEKSIKEIVDGFCTENNCEEATISFTTKNRNRVTVRRTMTLKSVLETSKTKVGSESVSIVSITNDRKTFSPTLIEQYGNPYIASAGTCKQLWSSGALLPKNAEFADYFNDLGERLISELDAAVDNEENSDEVVVIEEESGNADEMKKSSEALRKRQSQEHRRNGSDGKKEVEEERDATALENTGDGQKVVL